ncbi:MAG TPA: hypothetical protein VF254_08765 [Gammaproteobacteria bacterium]
MHALAILLERCRRFWQQSFDRLDDYLVKVQAKSGQQRRKR